MRANSELHFHERTVINDTTIPFTHRMVELAFVESCVREGSVRSVPFFLFFALPRNLGMVMVVFGSLIPSPSDGSSAPGARTLSAIG